jgi:hypothetical protein
MIVKLFGDKISLVGNLSTTNTLLAGFSQFSYLALGQVILYGIETRTRLCEPCEQDNVPISDQQKFSTIFTFANKRKKKQKRKLRMMIIQMLLIFFSRQT